MWISLGCVFGKQCYNMFCMIICFMCQLSPPSHRLLERGGLRMQSQTHPAQTWTMTRHLRYYTLIIAGVAAWHYFTCVWCCAPVFQGFICPQCMKSHNSAEELFKHYELFHDTGDLPAHVAPTRWDMIRKKHWAMVWLQCPIYIFLRCFYFCINIFSVSIQGRSFNAAARGSGPARLSEGEDEYLN